MLIPNVNQYFRSYRIKNLLLTKSATMNINLLLDIKFGLQLFIFIYVSDWLHALRPRFPHRPYWIDLS